MITRLLVNCGDDDVRVFDSFLLQWLVLKGYLAAFGEREVR